MSAAYAGLGPWVTRNGRGVALCTALVVSAGAVSYGDLPSGLYPELSFPRIAVVASLPDATSELVLRNVTRPLEEALLPIAGVRRVRSKTIRGAVEVAVLFEPDTDMARALTLVQGALPPLRGELPAATSLLAERVSPTSFPIFTVDVDGNVPPEELRDVALHLVRPTLLRLPGVGAVTVTAGLTREVEVEVDPARAEAAGLTVDEIARRLTAANQLATVGRFDRAYRRYAVVVRTDARDLGALVIGGTDEAPLRLADVARVSSGHADPQLAVRSPRGPTAVVNIARRVGGDVLSLDAEITRALAALTLPAGITVTPVYQQATLVRGATSAVLDAIAVGALLAGVVLFGFLRDVRAMLLATLTIPASLLAACLALRIFHGSLNLMSLGGLAIAVGLVVDDAVVVIEAIHRARRTLAPLAAAQEGVSRLAGPVVSSTITTVVVFLPLAFLSGVVGTFFAALSLALSAAVTASLLLALFVVPLVAGRFFANSATRADDRWAPRYGAWLARALDHPWRVVGAAGAILVVALLGATRLASDFLPELDEGAYVLDYFAPVGTSLAETDALAQQIDAILAADPDVQTFSRRLGAELGPPRATEASRGDVLVRLKRHHRPVDDLMEDQRRRIAARVPGLRVEMAQLLSDMLGDLEGSPEPVELKLFGDREEELRRQAARVAAAIADVPGLVDRFDGQVACSPERVVRVDALAAGRMGLSTQEVQSQLGAALAGVESTPLPVEDRLVPVRVRWPDGERFDERALTRVRLRTPRGWVPLTSVARLDDGCAPSEIERENLQRMVPVTARLEHGDLGRAMTDIEARLAPLLPTLPPGYRLEIGGQRAAQVASFRQLARVVIGALLLVLLVLVFQFRSFKKATAILAALPLALGGGLLALWVSSVALNVSSLLGTLLLVGLVVKNGILLVDEVDGAVDGVDPLPLAERLVAAGRVRLRPIVMTTACTLLGLVPLALGLGEGSELHRPLAITVIGGLTLSTLGTLFVVPSVYLLLHRRGAR